MMFVEPPNASSSVGNHERNVARVQDLRRAPLIRPPGAPAFSLPPVAPPGMYPPGMYPHGMYPSGMYPSGMYPAPAAIRAMGEAAPPTVPSARRQRDAAMMRAPQSAGEPYIHPALSAPPSPGAPASNPAPGPTPTPDESPIATEEPAGMSAYIPVPGCPHPLFLEFKRWSPVFLPSMEGGLALTVALTLIFDGAPLGVSPPSFGIIQILLLTYLVAGALFGLLLYFASSDTAWFTFLVIGGLLFPVALFAPLFGELLGGLLMLAALALALLLLGLRYQEVPEGAVRVTRLFGRHFRILRPGKHLRLPFERVEATLETVDHVYTTPVQSIQATSTHGTPYRARAACTAMYAVLPSEAYRAAPVKANWEPELQRILAETLRAALANWASRVIATGNVPPQGTITRAVLHEARAWAHKRGVWMMRVRVHSIQLEPGVAGLWAGTPGPAASGETVTPAGAAPPAGSVRGPTEPAAQADSGSWRSAVPDQAGSQPPPIVRAAPGPAAAADVGHSETSPETKTGENESDQPGEDGQSAEAPAISPEVLASAYDAVRDGRVSDPMTIRGVAQAFARVAAHPSEGADFSYDVAAAARVLWEYADRLDQRPALSAPAT